MQENTWEKEYRNPKLVSLSHEPNMAIKDFVRFLRKSGELKLENLSILDLGCGNGKNSKYFMDQGTEIKITGIEISETAIELAKELIPDGKFIKQSMGEPFPFLDASLDIILDVTSSNSLNEIERKNYIDESHRVLKPNGYFFLRTLCKDGDQNAKTLLKTNPGSEKDTYIMPEMDLVERVFSKEDLASTYSPLFDIVFIKKETHYTKFQGRSYKRNFWVTYMKKVVK